MLGLPEGLLAMANQGGLGGLPVSDGSVLRRPHHPLRGSLSVGTWPRAAVERELMLSIMGRTDQGRDERVERNFELSQQVSLSNPYRGHG